MVTNNSRDKGGKEYAVDVDWTRMEYIAYIMKAMTRLWSKHEMRQPENPCQDMKYRIVAGRVPNQYWT